MTEKEFYIWLGKRIRELREKRGIKQRELAEKTKIDGSFLSKVENSGKKISAYQINQILIAMGYTQADLLNETEKKTSHSPFPVSNLPNLAMANAVVF